MSSVNKVIIVGRLGNDPDVRQFQSGGNVTHISVATSEKWTDKNTGEPKEQTEWHRVSLFNRLGEIAAQYLRKGSLVYIEGSLQTRKYTDQQGIERYTTEIRASEMRMLGSASGNNTGINAPNNAHWNNQNQSMPAGQNQFVEQNTAYSSHQNAPSSNQNFNQSGTPNYAKRATGSTPQQTQNQGAMQGNLQGVYAPQAGKKAHDDDMPF